MNHLNTRVLHVLACLILLKNGQELKIPEKDQIYVKVGFSDYYRAKIIGKSFSIFCFQGK